MKKIRVLNSGDGDWQALYVDGKIVAEGHSLPIRDIIKLILPDCNFGEVWDDNDEVIDGRCPLVWDDKLESMRKFR